jgi:hypothetical protein
VAKFGFSHPITWVILSEAKYLFFLYTVTLLTTQEKADPSPAAADPGRHIMAPIGFCLS